MTFEQYSNAFTELATQSGYSQTNIDDCLAYSIKLFDNNVPVVYNTSHFCALVGYNKSYLKRAVLRNNYFYKKFEIVKKNGNKRMISEPLPSLKEIQLWILENILYKVTVSRYAKAYIPNVSLRQNTVFHKNQKKVLTIDLKDFFPSIQEKSIDSIFSSMGYSKILSSLFAKICCHNGFLPQGAPTSPYLSNLFMKPLDDEISIICNLKKIRYTRYADDLAFSGDFDEKELMTFLNKLLTGYNLQINPDKTKLMTQNDRQIITGVVVNKKLQVPFYKRNDLRQAMYFIKKFGLKSHIEKKQIKHSNYLEHIIGKVDFILQINPKDEEFLKYKEFLISLYYNQFD